MTELAPAAGAIGPDAISNQRFERHSSKHERTSNRWLASAGQFPSRMQSGCRAGLFPLKRLQKPAAQQAGREERFDLPDANERRQRQPVTGLRSGGGQTRLRIADETAEQHSSCRCDPGFDRGFLH
jgi:hypothetical protein